MILVAGLLSFVVFARVPVHALQTDFQSEFVHHALLLRTLDSDGSTPYSLWYVLQQALVGSNRDQPVLLNAGWLMLGALAVIKGIVLAGALLATSISRLRALVLSFLLGCAVAFPMPWFDRRSRIWAGPVHYLGTLPPNVFMSSTQLMADIAAVLAVLTITLWYQEQTTVRFASMAACGLLASAAKPGMAPALLGSFLVLSVIAVRSGRMPLRRAAVRAAVGGIVIGLPILSAYTTFMTGKGTLALHAEIRPFDTWTTFTNQWFPDLVASWAFPLVVLVALWTQRKSSTEPRKWLMPAWLVAVMSTIMFALLAEVDHTGKAFYAGNFAWGAMAANSGLYVVSVIAIMRMPWSVKWLPLTVLAVQATAGILYVNHFIDTGVFI
ncbi:MAG: hypothetical protein JWM47_4191 [Acidimicrobiales bacterium]|nr:hypothetical protein [Acidimicrobiales bacterium]